MHEVGFERLLNSSMTTTFEMRLVVVVLTLLDCLRVRHVHGQLHGTVTSDARIGNQAWRNCDNAGRAAQLTTPIVCTKELRELGSTVDNPSVRARIGCKVIVEGF